MTALQIKHFLEGIDKRIVRSLNSAKHRRLTSNSTKKDIQTSGDANAILASINEYDTEVLSQLAVSSVSDMNDRILDSYNRTKKKMEHVVRKHLGAARRLKARIKNAL